MIDILKALSDETRIRIVNLLLYQDLCVCDIEGILNITQSNASRHLTKLRNSGIITHEKKAQWVFYKINENFIKEHSMLVKYLQDQTFKDPKYLVDTKQLRGFVVTCFN